MGQLWPVCSGLPACGVQHTREQPWSLEKMVKRPEGLLAPSQGTTIEPYFDSHTDLQEFFEGGVLMNSPPKVNELVPQI